MYSPELGIVQEIYEVGLFLWFLVGILKVPSNIDGCKNLVRDHDMNPTTTYRDVVPQTNMEAHTAPLSRDSSLCRALFRVMHAF